MDEVKSKHEQIRKITKKRRSKTMRLLMNEKKELKRKNWECKSEERTKRLEELKKTMKAEEEDTYYRRLKKTCDEIQPQTQGHWWP